MSFITAAAIIGGGALVGGAISAIGASNAANTQANAAKNAQNISLQEFNTITGQEQPFLQGGYGALNALNYGLGTGPKPEGGAGGITSGQFNQPFTAAYMQQYSPAYKFQLQQGQQGVLNQDAGAQGALSGASLKDLMSFNQNYANTAFSNAFNQYQTQQQNTFGRLYDIANLGQAAASQQAQSGTALAGQQAQSATNIGTALGAGQIGVANALAGGVNNASLLAGLYGGQAGGFGAGPAGYTGAYGAGSDYLASIGGAA